MEKKITLSLVGLNGNAFNLMLAFFNQAEYEGWTHEEINLVLNEAMSSNYDHLLVTLQKHCK